MSNNINNGGPAFPCDRIPTQEGGMIISDGMTLRDYFAAKALPGLMGRNWSNHTGTDLELIELWAASSYAIADAMLRARGEA